MTRCNPAGRGGLGDPDRPGGSASRRVVLMQTVAGETIFQIDRDGPGAIRILNVLSLPTRPFS
jgi:hypothetical protein